MRDATGRPSFSNSRDRSPATAVSLSAAESMGKLLLVRVGRLCYQCGMGWRARVMAAVSVLLAAALSVTVGVAVGVLPKSWRPYLWMAWPISVALALAYASIAARQADAKGGDDGLLRARSGGPHARSRLLERVEDECSRYQKASMELGLVRSEEPHPWVSLVSARVGDAPEPVPHGTKLMDVFDGLGHAMLILGAPGSGKTTTMIRLLRELLAKAQEDSDMPIPVVLPLASWALRRQPLAQWILRAVAEKYGVAPRHVRAWLEDEQLVLLLDGLDEVAASHREDCAKAINMYRRQYGTMDMVICCRTREYELLQIPPALYGRLIVQPLDRQQIERFLDRSDGRFTGARAAFTQQTGLWELVDTPLVLSVLLNTFGEAAPSGNLGGSNPQEFLEMLFAEYVPAMLRHRVVTSQPPLRTIRSVAFLARQLERPEQTTYSSDLLDTLSLPERWWGTVLGLTNWFMLKAISVLGGLCRTPIIAIYIVDFQNIEGELATLRVR